jgi:hypothetical protein
METFQEYVDVVQEFFDAIGTIPAVLLVLAVLGTIIRLIVFFRRRRRKRREIAR